MNNRETATIIWLGIVLAACLCSRDIRGELWQVVKSFAHPKVVGPVMALAVWTVGLVALAHTVGLWKSDVRNDTVTWFVTVGFVFYFSLERVEDDGFFRNTARRAVAVTVFVEGFVNLAVFSLPVELVLLPVLTFLVMLVALSEGEEEYAPAHGLVSGVLSVIGACFLIYAAVRLAEDFDAAHTVRALVLPVWLTLGVLPFIYAVGLLRAYEEAFIRIDFHTDESTNRRRAKRTHRDGASAQVLQLGRCSAAQAKRLLLGRLVPGGIKRRRDYVQHDRALPREGSYGLAAEPQPQRPGPSGRNGPSRAADHEWLTRAREM